MTSVDDKINSKKSAAQQAEEIRRAATGTAEETRQTIGSIEQVVKQTAKEVKTIADLKNLESELQVSRKKVGTKLSGSSIDVVIVVSCEQGLIHPCCEPQT